MMELYKQPDTVAAIRIENVRKKFRLYHEKHETLKETILARKRSSFTELWALDGVSYEFEKGRTYGIIGENGSGKSTLLKTITRILRPDTGSIEVNGRTSALLELGAGFHPELTGRENIYLNGAILRLSRAEVNAKYDEIVNFSEIGNFIDMPVKNYSSGMYMRLGFAIAVNVDPDVLLIDEVLAVGDESFQTKCYEKISQFQKQGKTIVFVSHDLNAVQEICDSAVCLEHGRIIDSGDPPEVIGNYLARVSKKISAGHKNEFTSVDAKRVGTGEAEIVAVELIDRNGKRINQVKSGELVTVRVIAKFHTDIENPVFGISFRSLDDTYLYDLNNMWRGIKSGKFKKGQEIYVDYEQRISLLAGEYWISAAIAYSDIRKFFDMRNYVLPFSVRDDRRSRGLIDLGSVVKIVEASSNKIIRKF